MDTLISFEFSSIFTAEFFAENNAQMANSPDNEN
jgi:hypothetical protein